MRRLNIYALATTLALLAMQVENVGAQELYKYTDKNGKVTYSDKKPKPGEKAVRVDVDPNVNLMSSAPAVRNGVVQTPEEISSRLRERASRENVEKATLDAAQADLDIAKKALEDGREPREDERRIIVRKDSNSVLITEAYRTRIAGLEADVKRAEEALEAVKKNPPAPISPALREK